PVLPRTERRGGAEHSVGPVRDRPERHVGEGYGALWPDPGDDAGGPAAVEGSGAARSQDLCDPGQPAGLAGAGDGGAARRDLRRDGEEGAGGAVAGTAVALNQGATASRRAADGTDSAASA